jgi:hypothetical protein
MEYRGRSVSAAKTEFRWGVPRGRGGNPMDVSKILIELREERRQIEEAIVSLERLAQGRGKRRGRPPAWMSGATAVDAPKRRGRPPGSKNKVAAMAAGMSAKDSAA